MQLTTEGIPYPEAADPLASWPATVQSLAEFIGRATQSGKVTVDIVTAGASAVAAVVFPHPYATPPRVTATPETTTNNAPVTVSDITTTGCNIRAARNSGTLDVLVNWIAHGQPSGL